MITLFSFPLCTGCAVCWVGGVFDSGCWTLCVIIPICCSVWAFFGGNFVFVFPGTGRVAGRFLMFDVHGGVKVVGVCGCWLCYSYVARCRFSGGVVPRGFLPGAVLCPGRFVEVAIGGFFVDSSDVCFGSCWYFCGKGGECEPGRGVTSVHVSVPSGLHIKFFGFEAFFGCYDPGLPAFLYGDICFVFHESVLGMFVGLEAAFCGFLFCTSGCFIFCVGPG